MAIPVIYVFTQEQRLKNKVVVADLARFARWRQLAPVDEPGDESDVIENVFVRVTDLGKDDARRQKILTENPTWLRDIVDKERFLRTKVVVNIYQKFVIDIRESKTAQCISIVQAEQQ
jgi:hypothetical protein